MKLGNKCRIGTIFLLVFIFIGPVSAQRISESGKWNFSAVTDFAYYLKSDYVAETTHFAPVTGLYDGIKFQETLHAEYAENDIITIDCALTVNIVSLCPKVSVSVTPVPFCRFSAGAMAGTGWSLLGFEGMSQYDADTRSYNNLDPFRTWYTNCWVSGTLMFDAAALWPGDWHHIVAVASYELDSIRLLNAPSGCHVWEWGTVKGQADGLQYSQFYLLGYKMPCMISLAGVHAVLKGHFNADDYSGAYADYGGSFMQININPMIQMTWTKKDSVYIMGCFSSRRSFKQSHSSIDDEPLLTYSGREWYFDSIAVSWTHTL